MFIQQILNTGGTYFTLCPGITCKSIPVSSNYHGKSWENDSRIRTEEWLLQDFLVQINCPLKYIILVLRGCLQSARFGEMVWVLCVGEFMLNVCSFSMLHFVAVFLPRSLSLFLNIAE